MAEQNTKQDSEWRKILHKSLNKAGFKILEPRHPLYVVVVEDVIRDLLASQRHQLKQQVLDAIGSDEVVHEYMGEQGMLKDSAAEGRNDLRVDLKKRIEAVFDKEK